MAVFSPHLGGFSGDFPEKLEALSPDSWCSLGWYLIFLYYLCRYVGEAKDSAHTYLYMVKRSNKTLDMKLKHLSLCCLWALLPLALWAQTNAMSNRYPKQNIEA